MLNFKFSNSTYECGTDEAGRGCLAGPVTAAAVILKDDFQKLVIEYKTKTLSELFFTTYKSESHEEFAVSASISEIIASTINAFGFSEKSVEATKENIRFVKAIVDRKPDLQEILRWLENNGEFKYELTLLS